MLKELIHLANHLDQKGLKKEADFLDFIIRKASEDKSKDWKETNRTVMDGSLFVWERTRETSEGKKVTDIRALPSGVDPNDLPDTSSNPDETVTGESTQKKNDAEYRRQNLGNIFTIK